MLLKCLGFCRSKHTSSSQRHYPTVIEELCHQFSLADLRKSTNNFDRNLIIGRGGFGKVYKGCLQHNGVTDYTIALKRLDRESRQGTCEFKNEIELLCQLRHPNLVSLIGYCDHEDEKFIVYEYMSNGSLDRHLCGGDMEPLSWKKRLEICIGVARGLHYLHTGAKRTIFHLGIKPSNILLDNNMAPKLTDFGHSLQGPRFMSKPKPIQVDRIAGTYGYKAPEYCMYGTVTDKCDIYSFGTVLLEVVWAKDKQAIFSKMTKLSEGLGQIDYKQLENYIDLYTGPLCFDLVQRFPAEGIIDPILTGKIAPGCWKVFIDITERCLQNDPNERPTIGEVEVELENALSLQEEADNRNTNGDYTLSSTTIFKLGQLELEQDTDIEDTDTEDSLKSQAVTFNCTLA